MDELMYFDKIDCVCVLTFFNNQRWPEPDKQIC